MKLKEVVHHPYFVFALAILIPFLAIPLALLAFTNQFTLGGIAPFVLWNVVFITFSIALLHQSEQRSKPR